MLAGLARLTRLCGATLLVLAVLLAARASAATNIISASAVGSHTFPINANALKPAECAALNLTLVRVGSGGSGSELIVGSGGGDTISGGDGNDCVVTGGGDDALYGNNGNDVLLGGPGDDNIDGGAGTDVCYGGPGNDNFKNCETIIQ